MDERARRAVLNEAVFRQANEALAGLSGVRNPESALDLLCECGRIDCVDRIEIVPAEYERVRADPTLFAIVHGHAIHSVEDVVESHDGYDVVQKRPEAHGLAEETDPRSS